ncbi:Gag-Pol polyprotein [Frankliniella fusca]|uniref:Gag-Pol polyprotein n=1 Tax=Frankliniella fusca TaxID=407009 RepID=A0AAE1HAG4_9NEOP|nr:Gag-Pol polyprotein [Frankliniella fusca]
MDAQPPGAQPSRGVPPGYLVGPHVLTPGAPGYPPHHLPGSILPPPGYPPHHVPGSVLPPPGYPPHHVAGSVFYPPGYPPHHLPGAAMQYNPYTFSYPYQHPAYQHAMSMPFYPSMPMPYSGQFPPVSSQPLPQTHQAPQSPFSAELYSEPKSEKTEEPEEMAFRNDFFDECEKSSTHSLGVECQVTENETKPEITEIMELLQQDIIGEEVLLHDISAVDIDANDHALEASNLSSHSVGEAEEEGTKLGKKFTTLHVNTAVLKCKEPLRSIPAPRANLKQIGIDIIQLPEAEGFKFVVVAIDYLSKWSEAKGLQNKTAIEVARFIFEWICKFGCPSIVINDQGREFCNEVSEYLYKLTGTRQRVTSAYSPQANGQVERQNQIIKCGLLKCLRERVNEWPSILEAVLFAHRVQKQRSTGFSPFFLLFRQEPILPFDVKQADEKNEDFLDDPDDPEEVTIDNYLEKYEGKNSEDGLEDMHLVVERYIQLKTDVLVKARENIREAQNEQRKEYDKRNNARRDIFKPGQRVLLKNLRRDDRKGKWKHQAYTGPYTIVGITKKNKCILRNILTGNTLKTTHRQGNLKTYHKRPSKFCVTSATENVPEETANTSTGDVSLPPTDDEECEVKTPQAGQVVEVVGIQSTDQSVRILRNGNVLPAVSLNFELFQVNNTCGFDSIAQLSAVAFNDSTEYQKYVTATNEPFFRMVEMLNTNLTSMDRI